MGDSVGRWDGDTLVIETVNLTDRTWLDDHGNRHSDALRVTERWRRMSADELWYQATIDDASISVSQPDSCIAASRVAVPRSLWLA